MAKRRKKTGSRHGLQAVTLCISTAMVLILLGLVVFSVLTARNLSTYVKQNIVVTLMLQDDMTSGEAKQFCSKLKQRPYICRLDYISKEQALREGIKTLGADPREFADTNPFLSSIEITLNADYANTDSLQIISRELKSYPKVSEVKYQKDLIDSVNANIAKISIVLLTIALLLTIVSFSLINNTIRMNVYARRHTIHTMKLVGASWSFIRRPFLSRYFWTGVLAGFVADALLWGGAYLAVRWEPDLVKIITPGVMLLVSAAVLLFGVLITSLCALFSINKYLRMKASALYYI